MGTPRELHTQQIHYLRKGFTFADTGALTVGTLPAGALILKPISGIFVSTVFNAGTANVADIGTTADDDLFGTDLSLTALAFVPLDEAVGGFLVAAATDITVTPGLTGTAATTGAAEVVIAYIPDNDL
jgi:hypothetical protein